MGAVDQKVSKYVLSLLSWLIHLATVLQRLPHIELIMARLWHGGPFVAGEAKLVTGGEMGVGNLMVLLNIYKTINKAHSREFTTSDPSRGWMETLWVVVYHDHNIACTVLFVWNPAGEKEKKRKENYCMITKLGLRTHDFSRQRLLRAFYGNIATFKFGCLSLKNWSLSIHCTACHAMHHM